MIPADDLTPLLDKTPAEKQPRDIYHGVPDPAQDLAGAVAALRANMSTMLSDIGGTKGSVLTTEDLQKLTQAYDARYLGGDGAQSLSRAEVKSIQDQLKQAQQALYKVQNDADRVAEHLANYLNPHRTLHRYLLDRTNPDSHPQLAIGGRTGALGTAAALDADQVLQDTAIGNLQTAVSGLQSAVSSLQSTVSNHQSRIGALESA